MSALSLPAVKAIRWKLGITALLWLRYSYYRLFQFIAKKGHIALLVSLLIICFFKGHRARYDFSY